MNSWKEIARYLGRGVRTVQRWERDLNLPVHRPRGKQRSAVLAIPEELDKWLQDTPARALANSIENHVQLAQDLRSAARTAEAAKERARLRAQCQTLIQQAAAAREQMHRVLEQLHASSRLARDAANRSAGAASRANPGTQKTK